VCRQRCVNVVFVFPIPHFLSVHLHIYITYTACSTISISSSSSSSSLVALCTENIGELSLFRSSFLSSSSHFIAFIIGNEMNLVVVVICILINI